VRQAPLRWFLLMKRYSFLVPCFSYFVVYMEQILHLFISNLIKYIWIFRVEKSMPLLGSNYYTCLSLRLRKGRLTRCLTFLRCLKLVSTEPPFILTSCFSKSKQRCNMWRLLIYVGMGLLSQVWLKFVVIAMIMNS
jgi:hypothetical protein